MEDALATLVWVVAAAAAVVAVCPLAVSGRSWRQIGGGGIGTAEEDGSTGAAERDEEIRQHVLARNARRVPAGDEALDVDAEIARHIRELT